MSGFLLGLVSMCFVLSLIVVFHEFGHYITAKKSGILVREFSIGFGPLIWGKNKGETHYCVRGIPLGGYVDLAGMDENEELEDTNRAFFNKDPFIKFLVLFAGSFMNFVLAFLIYWVVYSGHGIMQKPFYSIPVVAAVMEKTPAYEVGILKGDEILSVDSVATRDWDDFRTYIQSHTGTPVKIRISRNGNSSDFTVTPKSHPKTGRGYIGLVPDTINELGEIAPDSPAANAKLKPGDRVLSINDRETRYFSQIEDLIKEFDKKQLTIAVRRGTAEITITANNEFADAFGVMPPNMPYIGDVMVGLPASRGGMEAGDRVVGIDNQPVETWYQMLGIVSKNPGRELPFKVRRGDKTVDLKITPMLEPSLKEGRIGVSIKNISGERLPVLEGANAAFRQTYMITVSMIDGIGRLISGGISFNSVVGPVGISKVVKDQATDGIVSLLMITALISINIGLLNLFPLPGLDGGRIIFTFLEAVRRKRLSSKIEEQIHTVGILMLIVLAVVVTYKDIVKLLGFN